MVKPSRGISSLLGFCLYRGKLRYNERSKHTFLFEVGVFVLNEIHISVRSLVEYVYSSGSIDSRFRPQSTMAEGTRVHQAIQKTYGDKDEREVYLSIDIPFEGLDYKIDGRCDGILYNNGQVTIDEKIPAARNSCFCFRFPPTEKASGNMPENIGSVRLSIHLTLPAQRMLSFATIIIFLTQRCHLNDCLRKRKSPRQFWSMRRIIWLTEAVRCSRRLSINRFFCK